MANIYLSDTDRQRLIASVAESVAEIEGDDEAAVLERAMKRMNNVELARTVNDYCPGELQRLCGFTIR